MTDIDDSDDLDPLEVAEELEAEAEDITHRLQAVQRQITETIEHWLLEVETRPDDCKIARMLRFVDEMKALRDEEQRQLERQRRFDAGLAQILAYLTATEGEA